MRPAIINWLTIVYTKPLTQCLALGENPVNIRHQCYDHAAAAAADVGIFELHIKYLTLKFRQCMDTLLPIDCV